MSAKHKSLAAPRRLIDVAPDLAHILERPMIHTPAKYAVAEIRYETLMVAMRDGVRLATDLYFPPKLPAPSVAVRTPYAKAGDAMVGVFLALARRGYVVISQDCRGTGNSEPDSWDYYMFESEDGYDFVEWVAEQGLIGIACVCYTPMVAPAGGNKPLFGTNPLSFAWPRPGRAPMVVDMATASMALGEVQIAAREGHTVPLGTGLDANGELTMDPNEILKGMLLPFGGYKGSAIALMVELLAAGAVGERFSFEAAEADPKDGGPPRGGEFMLAISPELLAGPDWAEHCESFFRRFAAIEGARLPGSRRHQNRLSMEARNIDSDLIERVRALCA